MKKVFYLALVAAFAFVVGCEKKATDASAPATSGTTTNK